MREKPVLPVRTIPSGTVPDFPGQIELPIRRSDKDNVDTVQMCPYPLT